VEKIMSEEKKHPNTIILWEDQKKRVCDFYACSDSHDRKYPNCEMKLRERPGDCYLIEILRLLDILNKERQ